MNTPLFLSSSFAVVLHIIVLAVLFMKPSYEPLKKKKLNIKTIKLAPEKHKVTAQPQKQKEKPAPLKSNSAQPVNKLKPAKEQQKEPEKMQQKKPLVSSPVKKPSVKKTETIQQKEAPRSSSTKDLLAKAKQSLNSIESSHPANSTMATSIPDLQTLDTEMEIAYQDELTQLLQLLLRLPEIGEINLKLTIARNGTIKKLEILSSESIPNRNYIEKTLPQHTMPELGKQFGNIDSHTFTITMKGLQT